jgi:hypothetical protein
MGLRENHTDQRITNTDRLTATAAILRDFIDSCIQSAEIQHFEC